ncbi:hypothetical protein L6452_38044 [Arctium lappa]|uniref:Uncharacterized protein n=1 Tax=Arctium lappa TaxID=4217 RepID=A0ACB8Y4N5_ARCLA|nr:hypothetical protein L6452_38044 [Arctium lappa]
MVTSCPFDKNETNAKRRERRNTKHPSYLLPSCSSATKLLHVLSVPHNFLKLLLVQLTIGSYLITYFSTLLLL